MLPIRFSIISIILPLWESKRGLLGCKGTTVKHFANGCFAVKLAIIRKYVRCSRIKYDMDVTFG